MALTSAFTTSVTNGNQLSLTDTSTAGAFAITGYDTNWGDASAHTTSANGSHTYTVAGTYTVTHVVTDSNAATSTATASIVIEMPPVANISITVSGFTATLTDTSTVGSHPISSYLTLWGDGTSTTANPASHTYGSGGFVIGHGVADSAGRTSTIYSDFITDGTALDHWH